MTLKLSQKQYKAMEMGAMLVFQKRVFEHFQKSAPQLLPEPQAEEILKEKLVAAKSRGLATEAELVDYVHFALLLGEDWDENDEIVGPPERRAKDIRGRMKTAEAYLEKLEHYVA